MQIEELKGIIGWLGNAATGFLDVWTEAYQPIATDFPMYVESYGEASSAPVSRMEILLPVTQSMTFIYEELKGVGGNSAILIEAKGFSISDPAMVQPYEILMDLIGNLGNSITGFLDVWYEAKMTTFEVIVNLPYEITNPASLDAALPYESIAQVFVDDVLPVEAHLFVTDTDGSGVGQYESLVDASAVSGLPFESEGYVLSIGPNASSKLVIKRMQSGSLQMKRVIQTIRHLAGHGS